MIRQSAMRWLRDSSFAPGGALLGVILASAMRNVSPHTPQRPGNTSAAAQWAGGADGGVWAECRPYVEPLLRCGLYADVTGVLLEKGDFRLDPSSLRLQFYSAGMLTAEVRFDRRVSGNTPASR